ncbi:flagellin lysine-N-methylase [Brevibacillus sp. NRS-1366]|uniref:flagellin lysine-N-methylase n=1 Tax=Brevibacillus sp. NRS-1366 TaxID=3233899 RepID=UPI003D24F1A7
MADNKQKIFVPSYMKQFACIGPSCEDTCCVGWRVNIDSATYKKYNKMRELNFKKVLDKHVKRNRSNPTEAHYAKIIMDSNGACPLLNDEKLCSVQAKMGDEYLSVTCSSYPRITNKVNGVLEKSATMSCPEAARLALLNSGGIQFEEIEESNTVRNAYFSQVDTLNKAENKIVQYFWELRIFSIQVLQNREYSLSDRLIALGMFFQKLQTYINDDKVTDIPKLIASYTKLLEDGLKGNLSAIPISATIQMLLVKKLNDMRFMKGVNSKRYVECCQEMAQGIGYTEDTSLELVTENYQKAYHKYYLPFMMEHEYILENYLVNYVYKNLFPVNNGKAVFDEYVMLVVHFAIIKLVLIGMAGFHKEKLNIDHIIKLIQSFAKIVEHSNSFLMEVRDLLRNSGYISMAYMSILIKN